jgi:hypothetical protein
MEGCSKTSFAPKVNGGLLQNKLLLKKLWSVAPKQTFAPKSDGELLQNKLFAPKVIVRCSQTL